MTTPEQLSFIATQAALAGLDVGLEIGDAGLDITGPDAGAAMSLLPTWKAALAKAEIKTKTREIIIARLPDWKQTNMTARAVELVAAGDTAGAEWLALQAAWGWVKAVRSHSNELEAQIDAGKTPDLTQGWPG